MNARERKTNYPAFTTEEFRDRIRKLLGVPEGAGKRSNPALVRKRTDKGYYPPKR